MGKLSLNSKLFNSIIFTPFESKNIVFKGPSGTTMGNFINAYDIYNVDGNGVINMYIGNLNTSPLITFISDGNDWLNLITEENLTNYVIPLNAIFQINSTSNLAVLLNLGGNATNYFQGQTSIKKQNLSILKSSNYNPIEQSVYIFKSAVNNTLGNIFNYAQFEPYTDAISIYIEGNLDGVYNSFYTDGSSFIYDDYTTNANNYVIPANSLLIFTTSYDINITVGGGAIIQKYYSGKISLKKN